MAGENQLFHIDVIVADGQAIAFEDSSATLSGAAGFKNDVKVSASGDDFTTRSRVPRMLKAKLQWAATDDPKKYAGMSNVQLAMRDSFTGRKVLAPKATFGELGDIGAGTVDVTFILNAELQWL
jgi:hypothetical protein